MEIQKEEVRTTTRFVISVTELAAIQGEGKGNLAELMHKALTTSNGHPATIDPEQAEVDIREAPAPRRRLPTTAGGQPLARCPKCKTDIVWYKLDTHVGNASCLAREKRNKAAERRQRKSQKLLEAPKE